MDIERFQTCIDKESRYAYLMTIDKCSFQLPKVLGEPRKWKCPGCPYYARSKQHLFNHMTRPCKDLQNKPLPFRNWEEYDWPKDLSFQYPEDVVEKIFKKLAEQKPNDLDSEGRILYWKKYMGILLRKIKSRGGLKTCFKFDGPKTYIRTDDKWMRVAEEGQEQYNLFKRVIILPFIKRNIDNWYQWYVHKEEPTRDWYDWSIAIFGKVVTPNIQDEFD